MKKGQNFENNFKNSIDKNDSSIFFYRFKDGTANWGPKDNKDKIRFQAHNISDYMIFYRHKLFILELKSHKGKSLPLNCIRNSQYEEMFNASFKDSVYPMLIIFFSDIIILISERLVTKVICHLFNNASALLTARCA